MQNFDQGLKIPIHTTGKQIDSMRSRKLGLASLGVDTRYQDNVYRDSFDIWKDSEDIMHDNDLYLNNNNHHKSSLPKGYAIMNDDRREFKESFRKTSVTSKSSKSESQRKPFSDLVQGGRGWSNDGKFFVKREEEKDKNCPVHGHGHVHGHAHGHGGHTLGHNGKKKRESTPTMLRKTSAPSPSSKVTTQKVEMKFGMSPFRKTSLPVTKSETSVASGGIRKQSSEILKSKPPSGDLKLPPTGDPRHRRSTSSEPLQAPLLIRKTSVSSVELNKEKLFQLDKLDQRYKSNGSVGKMSSSISSDLFRRSDELRRSLSLKPLKPYTTNISNTKGASGQQNTLPREYSSNISTKWTGSLPHSQLNRTGSSLGATEGPLGVTSGSLGATAGSLGVTAGSLGVPEDSRDSISYRTTGSENSISRQRSFPDLRRFSESVSGDRKKSGDSQNKTVVKIEDKRKSDLSSGSRLQRGPGRFSLKHRSGGSISTPSLGSVGAGGYTGNNTGNYAGINNGISTGSNSGNNNGGRNFQTPTFSSLTRSLSGLNLAENPGKKFTSTTDIRYSSNTNQNMSRKISEPNLRRHYEQQPSGSLRKLSDSQLPRKQQSDYYSQQLSAARKLSDSQLPGTRKLSDSTLPGVRKIVDSLPSRKTSLPAQLTRKLSSESSLPRSAEGSTRSSWTLPGRKMLSSSSLTGWKSSSNMYDPAPAASSRTLAASSSSSSVFSPSSLLSQMTRKLSSSPRGSPAPPPRGSPAPESICDERGSEYSGTSGHPSREWPYCSILKTPGKRRSGMKHVEFLDNLSECDYVAREY